MADDIKKQFQQPLTMREKVSILALLILLKLVKPTDYSHEYSDEVKRIRELIDLV